MRIARTPRNVRIGNWSSGTLRRCVTTYAATLDEIQAGLGDAARLSLPRLERSNATSQARRLIIGAGFGSTATHTLTHALGVLKLEASHDHTSPMRNGIKFPAATRSWRSGFNRFRHPRFRSGPGLASCMDELHTMDVTAGLEYVDAVVDMPTAEFFLPLFAAFPNARVILTTRSGSSWGRARRRRARSGGPRGDRRSSRGSSGCRRAPRPRCGSWRPAPRSRHPRRGPSRRP